MKYTEMYVLMKYCEMLSHYVKCDGKGDSKKTIVFLFYPKAHFINITNLKTADTYKYKRISQNPSSVIPQRTH